MDDDWKDVLGVIEKEPLFCGDKVRCYDHFNNLCEGEVTEIKIVSDEIEVWVTIADHQHIILRNTCYIKRLETCDKQIVNHHGKKMTQVEEYELHPGVKKRKLDNASHRFIEDYKDNCDLIWQELGSL